MQTTCTHFKTLFFKSFPTTAMLIKTVKFIYKPSRVIKKYRQTHSFFLKNPQNDYLAK